jgi:transketolase C-terminal domain/subunit
MKVVKFRKSHLSYQPGEAAGFEDGIAETLIASGVAVDRNQANPAEVPALGVRISVTSVVAAPPAKPAAKPKQTGKPKPAASGPKEE